MNAITHARAPLCKCRVCNAQRSKSGGCPIIHLDPKRGVKRRSNGDVASVNSDDSSGDDE